MLGEYEFNPFVDVDVELDYDENMEEPSTVENSQEEQIKNEEGKEVRWNWLVSHVLVCCCTCFDLSVWELIS